MGVFTEPRSGSLYSARRFFELSGRPRLSHLAESFIDPALYRATRAELLVAKQTIPAQNRRTGNIIGVEAREDVRRIEMLDRVPHQVPLHISISRADRRRIEPLIIQPGIAVKRGI